MQGLHRLRCCAGVCRQCVRSPGVRLWCRSGTAGVQQRRSSNAAAARGPRLLTPLTRTIYAQKRPARAAGRGKPRNRSGPARESVCMPTAQDHGTAAAGAPQCGSCAIGGPHQTGISHHEQALISAMCTPCAGQHCVKPRRHMHTSFVRITCGAAVQPAGSGRAQHTAHAPGTRRSQQGTFATLPVLWRHSLCARSRLQGAGQRGSAPRSVHLWRVQCFPFRRTGRNHVDFHRLADSL